MFGFTKSNPDAFARPIYDDAVRTNNIGFFPPAVYPSVNGMKLNVAQTSELERYIGQARKGYVAPYINDAAIIPGYDVKYSQLSDTDKVDVLKYLYDLGREDGIDRFLEKYPAFEKEEKEKDYIKEAQKKVFRALNKYKNE